MPKQPIDPKLHQPAIDPKKLGPEARKFFANNVMICDAPREDEAAYRESNEVIAALDQEFLRLPPKKRR